jgi:hypothetical protein
MKIKILESAKQDLLEGYYFYENQKEGLGEYFLDSLFSDIESLHLYAGIHQKFFGFYRMLSKRFPLTPSCHMGEGKLDLIQKIKQKSIRN